MTSETQSSNTTDHKHPIPFGTRLKSAREAMGLERKDAAAQLRLNEKIILMMEKDRYPIDLPVTFIRGYIRAYGKLLQIPEYEIKKAIEPIKPKQTNHDMTSAIAKSAMPMTSGNYFMQFFTYLIVITIAGLVGVWWYMHTGPVSLPLNTESQTKLLSEEVGPPIQPPSVIGVGSIPKPMRKAHKVKMSESDHTSGNNADTTQPRLDANKAMPSANPTIDRTHLSQQADPYADLEDVEEHSGPE